MTEKSESKHEQPAGSDKSLKNKLSLFTLAGFILVLCQVCCEVGKQVSNYSIQYYNGGKYPLPQTVIVVLVELIKLVTIIARSGCQCPSFDSQSLRQSVKFILPSLLYAVGNNIYLAGLILVPPPIWIILTSFRTVVTATLYKFILKREVTYVQFGGALLIVTSIVVAKLGDVMSAGNENEIPLFVFILAAIASINSVGAAVYTESLFKTTNQNFLEQQFWLYLYGALVSLCVHVVSTANINPMHFIIELQSSSVQVKTLLFIALLLSSVGGMVVAAILKRLDNIVKEYSGATANIFTAIICSLLFPEKFTFTIYILLAMLFLFAGIYLYENGKHKLKVNTEEKNKVPDKSSAVLI